MFGIAKVGPFSLDRHNPTYSFLRSVFESKRLWRRLVALKAEVGDAGTQRHTRHRIQMHNAELRGCGSPFHSNGRLKPDHFNCSLAPTLSCACLVLE